MIVKDPISLVKNMLASEETFVLFLRVQGLLPMNISCKYGSSNGSAIILLQQSGSQRKLSVTRSLRVALLLEEVE